jgi:hypothetical protein
MGRGMPRPASPPLRRLHVALATGRSRAGHRLSWLENHFPTLAKVTRSLCNRTLHPGHRRSWLGSHSLTFARVPPDQPLRRLRTAPATGRSRAGHRRSWLENHFPTLAKVTRSLCNRTPHPGHRRSWLGSHPLTFARVPPDQPLRRLRVATATGRSAPGAGSPGLKTTS